MVITMDEHRRVFPSGSVLIEDDHITAVGRSGELSATAADNVVEAAGEIILPGLINTHVHLSQQLGRGLGDDVDLITWLHERIWPYESSMTSEDSYYSSLLCGIELIRSGVTCFAEAGGQHVSSMARAIEELGLRGILARSTMDTGEGPEAMIEPTSVCIAKQEELIDRWHGKADGRIRVWPSCRTIFNCSDDLYLRTKELADKYHVGITAHIAEVQEEVEYAKSTRGETTVAHLDKLGVLGPNFLSVHTVWTTDEEVATLARQGVHVSYNPAAAMRVLGFAKIPEMMKAGVNVTIGTDGAPSNNRMNLISEMYLASLINKGRSLDPSILPAHQVLEMVTTNSARALMWDKEIGSIKPEKKADLVIIDPNSANMLPLHDPIANLVYAMDARNVKSVFVDGSALLKDNVVQTVDESDVIARATQAARELVVRAGINLPARFLPVV